MTCDSTPHLGATRKAAPWPLTSTSAAPSARSTRSGTGRPLTWHALRVPPLLPPSPPGTALSNASSPSPRGAGIGGAPGPEASARAAAEATTVSAQRRTREAPQRTGEQRGNSFSVRVADEEDGLRGVGARAARERRAPPAHGAPANWAPRARVRPATRLQRRRRGGRADVLLEHRSAARLAHGVDLARRSGAALLGSCAQAVAGSRAAPALICRSRTGR